MIFQQLFDLTEHMLMFNIILHLATLCAVVIVFRKKIWELVQNPLCKTNLCLLTATVITCIFVVLLKGTIDSLFAFGVLPVTFMVTAIVLFLTTLLPQTRHNEVTYRTGIFAGLTQGIAVVPGLSRSGCTIAACLADGVNRDEAAQFSFLMSIPIIVASFVFELMSTSAQINIQAIPLLFAFVAALLSGILAIKLMLKLIKEIKLYWFSVYLVILSGILLFI